MLGDRADIICMQARRQRLGLQGVIVAQVTEISYLGIYRFSDLVLKPSRFFAILQNPTPLLSQLSPALLDFTNLPSLTTSRIQHVYARAAQEPFRLFWYHQCERDAPYRDQGSGSYQAIRQRPFARPTCAQGSSSSTYHNHYQQSTVRLMYYPFDSG